MFLSWQTRSACIDQDPDIFFPIGSTGYAREQITLAKEICQECTVRLECLDWAIVSRQDTGIWGGTTEEERRQLRRHEVA